MNISKNNQDMVITFGIVLEESASSLTQGAGGPLLERPHNTRQRPDR
jgi:hypothetical protein